MHMHSSFCAMNYSLTSSLRSANKPFLSRQNSCKWQQNASIVIAASFRASSKIACENDYEPNNFYRVLTLSADNASFDEVKRAYRTMALRYLPDLICDPSKKAEATRVFVEVTTLSDPVLREKYDYQLRFSRNNFGDFFVDDYDEAAMRNMWQNQIIELKKRAEKDGYWGSKMRAQNIHKR